MYSNLSQIKKHFLQSICLSGFIFHLTSCGLSLNEKKPESKPVDLKNTSTTCLDQSIDTVKKMVKGDALDQDIAPAFNCLSDTLNTFTVNVQGRNKSSFDPEEVVYFLNTNFVKSQKPIPLELIQEIMKLKVALVGGTQSVLEKTELMQLNDLIKKLNSEFVSLNPHLKVITTNLNIENITDAEKDEKFNAAKVALLHFSTILGQSFAETYTEYDINSMFDLVLTIMKYGDSNSEQIAHIEKYRSIAVEVKSNMIGQTSPLVKNNDWPVLTKALSETLFLVLRNNYYGKPYNAKYGLRPENKISQHSQLVNDVALAVSELLQMQNNRVLTYDQMVPIFNSVFKTFNLEVVFDSAILKDFTLVKNATTTFNFSTNANGWDKNDFKQLHNKINIFFHDFGIIHRELMIMSDDEAWKTNYNLFLSYESKINPPADDLAKIFVSKYDLQNLKSFLTSLRRSGFLKKDTLIKNYEKYCNSILSTQNLINSNQGTIMDGRDLQNILTTGVSSYLHYLEFKNYIDIYKIQQAEFNVNAKVLLPKVIKTLSSSLNQNEQHFFSTQHLIKTYRAAVSDFELKSLMTDDSLKITLDLLWSNFLVNPKDRLAGVTLKGFDKSAVNNLTEIANAYLTSNILSIGAFNGKADTTQNEYIDRLSQLIQLNSDPTERLLLNEMKVATSSPVPLGVENDFLKILDPNSSIYNYRTIELSNISRLLSRLLIQSLTLKNEVLNQLSDSATYQTGYLTLDELQAFFQIAHPVLIDLDIVAEDNLKFMKKRFSETDLFVTRSNGNDLAEFFEIHDIAIHLMTGTARANVIKEKIISNCLDTVPSPYNRKTEIYDLCLIQVYQNFNEGFELIPSYLQLKSTYGETKFNEYSMNLLLAAGHLEVPQKTVLFENADNYPHVVQYVEMMYARFDTNKNNVIEKYEALAAFPVFKNTIKQVVAKTSGGSAVREEDLPGVFIFFLKYGKAPKGLIGETSFPNFLKFIRDPEQKGWDIQTDRFGLGLVFKFLAGST